ncbi:MAG: hypothetical protein IPM95_12295 [Sphingobacteriales bacterium]|nr:hypothetical protein [Sphingobacteriales bacterium]
MSLSTWLTDYVFFYLGAYKASGAKVVFNVIFVLALCGLWHGANWPMVISFTMVGVCMAIRYLWQNNVVRAIRPSNSYKLFNKYFPGWAHSVVTILIFLFCFLLFRVYSAQMAYNHAHPGAPVEWTTIARCLVWKSVQTEFSRLYERLADAQRHGAVCNTFRFYLYFIFGGSTDWRHQN